MTGHLTRQDRAVLAIAILALLLPLLAGAALVARTHAAAKQRIAQIEPRHARLLGLETSQSRLTQSGADAQGLMAQYVYPASLQASQAGNDAQQRIRASFTAAKLDLLSSQVLAPKAEQNLERIPLSVRAEGELSALQSALIGLSGQSPAIFVENLNIQANSYARAESGRLVIQVQLYVLRARS